MQETQFFDVFLNGLFDGVLTVFLEGLMFLRFSLMVLFMVDGFWLFVWRVFGLLAFMVLRWFLMVSAIPVWGLLCTHRSIHLGLINWTICRASASIQAARQQIGVHFKKNGSWTTPTLHLATILAYRLYYGYIICAYGGNKVPHCRVGAPSRWQTPVQSMLARRL